jgi:hypothetical protein
MNPKNRLVLGRLGNLFNLPDYFAEALDDKDREVLGMKFMLYYNESNFIDNAIPTLAALLSLGHMRLVLIDGYPEPVWFRAKVVLAQLIRNILPEKTTMKLLDTNVFYKKVESAVDCHEMFLKYREEGESEDFEIIDLRDKDWALYVRNEFPELYPKDDTDNSRH